MQFLERADALAALLEYAGDARAGTGRVVLVSGEAGAGKSSLVDNLRAATPDLVWGVGACDGLFTPRPLGPLFEIAEDLGGALLLACQRDAPRDEIFATLLRQLSTSDTATALLIEDVHWADESTLDMLRYLGRRIRASRGLIVATYRNDALAPDHPLRVVLGALAAERAVRRVTVPRLSETAVGLLAAESGISGAELHRLTGGNAFFVTEVLRAGTSVLPPSARDVVLARVALLSSSARVAVEVAALVGRQVQPRLLAAVAGSAGDELDELLGSGLLVSEPDGLRFRHEITRLAVEQQIPAHRRAEISTGLLAALRGDGTRDDALLAFYAEAAGDRDAVLHYAVRAGRRAGTLGSHREAAAQYERALRFAVDVDEPTRAGLNDALAGEAALIDDWERAALAGKRALDSWRCAGEPLRAGNALRELSRSMWRLCRGEEARTYAEEAVSMLAPCGATPELAWAYTHLAAIRIHRGERDTAFATADTAREVGSRFGLADTISDALATEPRFAWTAGPAWQRTLSQSLRAALDNGVHQQAARVYANLCQMLVTAKQFHAAEGYLHEGIAFCEEHDIAAFGIRLHATFAELLLETGRWDAAASRCRRLLATGASPFNRVLPAMVLARILARRADEAAWPHLQEAVASADRAELPVLIAETRLARAEAHWLGGQPAAASRDVATAAAATDTHEWLRGALATWQRRLGSDVSVAPDSIAAPDARSLVGDHTGAAAAWDRIGSPYDAALALLDSTSESGLREALRRFDALGAVAAARITRREMRRLGLRSVPSGPQPATRSNVAGLTRREREVLRLVSAGHSNEEISQQLVISKRTVDHHVSAVLSKLGINSRRAVAAEARRRGLLGARTDGEK